MTARARFLSAIGVLAIALTLPLGARPALAADATFGAPTASATWGQGVEFEQPVSLARAASRVELLISSPLDPGGFFVADTGTAESGSETLRYELDASADGMTPNTTYVGRWRLTFADGTSVTGPSVRTTYRDTRFEWRTITGRTVRIHWYVGDDAFGRRALAIAERAIDSSSSLLGVTETRLVDFFVYAEEDAFYDALGPGTRENVGGQAIPELRTLFALITPGSIDDGWVEIVIPHELSHLVFDTAVKNPYHYPPSWLNEGLAVYLAQGYDRSDRGLVFDAVRDGSLMPLEALTGQFPTTYEMFSLAYAESVSAVDFAVRAYGKAALVKLVRSYATGVSDDEALTAAFGVDAGGFQAAWLKDIGGRAPTRYGPVPAVPGTVPEAWAGPAATPEVGGSSGGPAGPSEGPGNGGGTVERPEAAFDPTLEGLSVGLLVAIGIACIVYIVLRGRRPSAAAGSGGGDPTGVGGDDPDGGGG